MDRRTVLTCFALPLGFAGVFHLVGVWPGAVLLLFASVWVGRGLRLLGPRWGAHVPAYSYFVVSAAMPGALVMGREALSGPTLSLLLGVSAFKLWALFSLPLWMDTAWAYRLVGSGVRYLLVVLGALAASVGLHAVLFASSPVGWLPLLAGFYLEFVLLLTTSEFIGG